MQVELTNITTDAEAFISYIARVSNPSNQDNPEYTKLIKFLIKNRHYSPFEHAYMTIQIKTSRAIAAQILRHRSFTFQEFSQRYSEATEFEPIELRQQATKNRQSSVGYTNPLIRDVNSPFFMYNDQRGMLPIQTLASEVVAITMQKVGILYAELLNAGVAKETARMILPLTTQTTLYMTGSIRSWIHYLDLRTKDDVQKEHRDVALQIKAIFDAQLPTISDALRELQKEQEDKEFLYNLLVTGKLNLEDYT